VLGVTLFSGTLLLLANLVVDVLYAYLDPRIRLE
jgi:ABC-type dipeptide/oligopeptide/nickel transport system permease component